MNNILIFDLIGPMAHFRRFDTNSSSLTYTFPSRTTIAGLLAGILGYEKDTYYTLFSPKYCNIGLSVKTKTRKWMQTVNYMFVKSKSDLNNSKGHTQIPLEFVLPSVPQMSYQVSRERPTLRYRIYFYHQQEELLKELKERIQSSEYVYPPYLGITELLASIEWVAEVKTPYLEQKTSGEPVSIHTVCNVEDIEERSLVFFSQSQENVPLTYYKERMTRSFYDDRSIQETANYVYETTGRLRAVVKSSYIQLSYNGQTENILFM